MLRFCYLVASLAGRRDSGVFQDSSNTDYKNMKLYFLIIHRINDYSVLSSIVIGF